MKRSSRCLALLAMLPARGEIATATCPDCNRNIRMGAIDSRTMTQTTPTHRLYSGAALQGSLTITVAEPLSHPRAVAKYASLGLAMPLGIIVPFRLLGCRRSPLPRTAGRPTDRHYASAAVPCPLHRA